MYVTPADVRSHPGVIYSSYTGYLPLAPIPYILAYISLMAAISSLEARFKFFRKQHIQILPEIMLIG